MMYKRCSGCGAKITADKKKCDKCLEKEKHRHVEYNVKKRNKKHALFYVSNAWKQARKRAMSTYSSLDVYEFVVNKRVVHADEVHHIVSLEDAWGRRLDANNLIPLSHANHMKIEAIYRSDEHSKQRLQEQLLKACQAFKSDGGIV